MTAVPARPRPGLRGPDGFEVIASSVRGGAPAYLALFLAVHVGLALSSTGPTPAAVVDLALVTVAAGLVVLRRDEGPLRTAVVVLTLVVVAVVGTWALPPGGRPGFDAWHLGAITFVLLGLGIQGRYLIAWSAFAAVAAVAVSWALLTRQSPLVGVALVDRHAGTLLVGTLFAIGLRRAVGQEAVLRAFERRQRAAERAAEVRREARRLAAESVLAEASPALRRIASGAPQGVEERTALLVLEGSLRDGIRAPLLHRSPLREAVAAARGRGINVLLLDEAGSSDRAAVLAWFAQQLDATPSGRFVGRVRRRADGLRATAVTDAARRQRTFPA